MEGNVGCDCGGAWKEENGELVCSDCGKKAPFQPAPTYLELISEVNSLKQMLGKANDRIIELQKKLEALGQAV
ncbi:hypothetical protein ES703_117978 [subsurface metagenome]